MRGDAAENSIDRLGSQQLSADFQAGIDALRVFHRDLQVWIFDLLGSLHHRLHGVGVDLSAVLVELRAEIFLRLVVLAGSHNNGVFHRAHHNLRIDSLFPAHAFDDVVELTSHKKTI